MGGATSGRTADIWTPEKLAELRSLAGSGKLMREAAEAFGVSKTAIRHAAGVTRCPAAFCAPSPQGAVS